jgi:hypothetical protein
MLAHELRSHIFATVLSPVQRRSIRFAPSLVAIIGPQGFPLFLRSVDSKQFEIP